MRLVSRLLILLLVAAPFAGDRPAFAQDSDIESMSPEERHEEAVRLFQLGELHYAGNEFGEAAEKFSRAWELEPNAILALNAALAYENAGQLEQALEWFRRTLESDPDSGASGQAERGIARIEAILQSVQEQRDAAPGTLVLSSQPDGARVLVDGDEVGSTPYTGALEPGEHSLIVTADGFISYEETLAVAAGETIRMVVPLVAIAVGGPGDGDPPSDSRSGGIDLPLYPAWILLGLAVAETAGAVYFGLEAQKTADSLENDVEILRDNDLFENTRSDGEQQALLSNLGYIGGIASTAGALGWIAIRAILREGPTESDETARSTILVLPDLHGASVRVSW